MGAGRDVPARGPLAGRRIWTLKRRSGPKRGQCVLRLLELSQTTSAKLSLSWDPTHCPAEPVCPKCWRQLPAYREGSRRPARWSYCNDKQKAGMRLTTAPDQAEASERRRPSRALTVVEQHGRRLPAAERTGDLKAGTLRGFPVPSHVRLPGKAEPCRAPF